MKTLVCPINGPRPIQEFSYGGDVRAMPDPALGTDADWADYIFNRDGASRLKQEWWFHIASNTWFIAERDVVDDTIIRTYLFDEDL